MDASTCPTLSRQERAVLLLLVAGMSNDEIGAQLGISEATVKAHVSRLLRKFGVATRTELAVRAVRLGIEDEVHPDGRAEKAANRYRC